MGAGAGHNDDRAGARGGRADRARDVALFRYALIREAADPQLSTRARGRLVRDLAGREHAGPSGQRVQVSRVTLDRWILAWRRGGFEALLPSMRACEPVTSAAVLELAAALKREVPARTAAQVAAILGAHAGPGGPVPSARTLQRHFARPELNTRPDGSAPKAFGRFEAAAANDRWTGDALHGPVVAGRKTFLFAFVDDHSRALVGYRWGHSEDTVRLEAALRAGLASRGIPKVVYLDNGSAMVSSQLLRALAVLGIKLTHSKPGQPAGRGKIERLFRTVREQFLVELAAPGASAAVSDLARLNELFAAWVETVYHQRVHSETGHKPLERFLAAGPPTPAAPELLHEAFLWSHTRRGHQDRHAEPARQHLRGRRRPGRTPGRGRVQPVRPDHPAGALPGPSDGNRRPATDRASRPSRRPPRPATAPARTDRDRLPRAGRRPAPRPARRPDQLHRPTPRPRHRPGTRPGPEPAYPTDLAEQPRPSRPTPAQAPTPAPDRVPEQIPGQLDLTDLIDPGDGNPDAAGRPR